MTLILQWLRASIRPGATHYSNRIVGYSISDRMKARLAVAAVENAVARRGDLVVAVGTEEGLEQTAAILRKG
jgi:hypothetical protein